MIRRLVTTAAAIVVVLPISGAALAAPERRVWVGSVVASTAYAANHTLYSVQRVVDCKSDCTRLMRSDDGGASWRPAAASAWSGASVVAARLGGREVLVSPSQDGIEVSYDGGEAFEAINSPTGAVDVAPSATGGLDVVVSGADGQYLLELPGGDVRKLEGTSLDSAQISFHPSWPEVPEGQPAALASGAHPRTGLPVVQPCDASLTCTGGTAVDTKPGLAPLHLSPRFDRDGIVFAAHIRGGLFRSTDRGRSFRPVRVAPATDKELISTVQSMAFGQASVFAGVLSVSGKEGGSGRIDGGVYRSDDAGVTWDKVGGASDLDRGVTALAAAGDRVLAAPMSAFAAPAAPVLCSVDLEAWRTSCPAVEPAGEPAARSSNEGAGDTSKGGRGEKRAEDRARGGDEQERRGDGNTRAAGDSSSSSSSPVAVLALLGAAGLAIAAAAMRSLVKR